MHEAARLGDRPVDGAGRTLAERTGAEHGAQRDEYGGRTAPLVHCQGRLIGPNKYANEEGGRWHSRLGVVLGQPEVVSSKNKIGRYDGSYRQGPQRAGFPSRPRDQAPRPPGNDH